MRKKRVKAAGWDAARVRSLRRHMELSQEEMAEELGTRQQTVSEWETGRYRPRGASSTLLTIVAERAGFKYDPGGGAAPSEDEQVTAAREGPDERDDSNSSS